MTSLLLLDITVLVAREAGKAVPDLCSLGTASVFFKVKRESGRNLEILLPPYFREGVMGLGEPAKLSCAPWGGRERETHAVERREQAEWESQTERETERKRKGRVGEEKLGK